MKKKLLPGLVVLYLFVNTVIAQTRSVTGVITASDDGAPVPGASVKIKGSSIGTLSDSNGKFSIPVPDNGTLVISFIGYASQEILVAGKSALTIRLDPDSKQLGEVVVTALGVSREKKSIGYAVQEVKGDNLTFAKSVDINASLAGKVAGVQLVGSPSSSFDNANIVIRGVGSLSATPGGGNGTVASLGANTRAATSSGITSFASSDNPLYIVDGTPTNPANVIMENVESVSVLKGASATALYGNRAQYGVVVITSKKGAMSGPPAVEFNLGATFENISLMPKYQNEYAGGFKSAYTSTAQAASSGNPLDNEGFPLFHYDPSIHPAEWATFDGQRMLQYDYDESWGPKMNGQQYRPYYSWYEGDGFGKTTALVANPDNVKNFFQSGTNLNNSVAIRGGGDKYRYRLAYSNQYRNLVQPGANRKQNQIAVNGNYDISKNFTVSTDLAFTNNNLKGQPFEGYRNDGLNVTQNFNQWFQRQLDLDLLKNYRTPSGGVTSWNINSPNTSGDLNEITHPAYWDSPWFVVDENYQTAKTNLLTGNLGLNYKLNDIFNITAYARLNSNTGNGDFRMATGGLQLDAYSYHQYFDTETNYEANLNFKKSFGELSLNGFIGGNLRRSRFELLENSTAGGLSAPNYFDISASIARPNTIKTVDNRNVRSVYGRVSFGYKNFLYLDGTLRNDWSSTLPKDNNSYLYPSVSSSFVFSELLGANVRRVLSFAKIRGSYAQVGSDLGFNQVRIAINNGSTYGSDASFEIGNQYRSGKVKPALTKSWEVGSELRFFNRFGLDFAYYVDNNINQIISLDIPSTTGYSSAQVNAGNIQRKGWELSLNATPLKSKNFNWDVTLNFAKNTSVVKELANGKDSYLYGNSWNDTYLYHFVGEQWGTIVGREWKRDDQGRLVFSSASGNAAYTTNNKIAQVLPDWTGGFVNAFRYKNLDLAFSLDFQKGGNFFSSTKQFNLGSGLSAYTVGVNDKGNDIREFPDNGGGVRVDGVNTAGEPTTIYVSARRYYSNIMQADAHNFIVDASYLKLRDVRIGYNLPKALFGNAVKNANLGVFVGNAWLIAAPGKKWGVDPSELENVWTEGGQLPSTRQYGLNLKVTF
ncbi:SusC/RagA family TonB-linked outer membrane protein [Pedobacter sp. HMF7647]|uniref:SusC/RagA family TonB-linked outer membrane protein n=1 Tax=Hufsiella arboris TaxID=2695275 RepID=A0A7K1YE79_9SPHI|nr:SusC/RagA family TonB-linked outer membrane protein [Hufsiella arboris]MXV52895.1 SusC/RagA family TonB-linked outer membrane protein [Hufsiella arboris]